MNKTNEFPKDFYGVVQLLPIKWKAGGTWMVKDSQ